MTALALTPGAPRAVNEGCLCPILDNAHGRGCGSNTTGPLYVIREDCPLHGDERRDPAIERARGEGEK